MLIQSVSVDIFNVISDHLCHVMSWFLTPISSHDMYSYLFFSFPSSVADFFVPCHLCNMHWCTLFQVERCGLNMEDTVKKKKKEKSSFFQVHSMWNNQQDDMKIVLKIIIIIHVQSIFLDFQITKTDKNTMWEGCWSKHYKGIFTINL